MLDVLKTFILVLAQVFTFAIVVRAIISWFPARANNPLVAIVYQMTEPILAPLRMVVPRVGMMDLTPLIAILILQFVVPILVTRLL